MKKKLTKENFVEVLNDLVDQLHNEIKRDYAIYGPYSNGAKTKITLSKVYRFLGYGRLRITETYRFEKMQEVIQKILNINKDIFVLWMVKCKTKNDYYKVAN